MNSFLRPEDTLGRWMESSALQTKQKLSKKILGSCIEVCTLMWGQQVQRAGYGGLGRADIARNDVLQMFQLASIDICHSEGTVNSQKRI